MASERAQRQIDRLLDQAEEALQSNDWVVVHEKAQNALDLDPDNADAPTFLAAAERALGRASATPGETDQASTPASTTPVPTSFADGRYKVNKFLGEGGKKKVYLAHDKTLDRDVAFALIKTEGLDDASRTRVSREAQAMGRLGDHPHIVTVYDLGEEDGQPYMVLPVLTGGDVEGLIEDAPEHRVPMEQALKIARETCLGLEFAHSKGIIHRDLKPGNVWLSEDGTAKIGDFGLAVATDRSRLTQEGMMVGTASYMPPEQAMGGEVTAQSDLYSLGAMLYELVTGRPPFLGDDPVAIIGQHINTPPVSPTWHNPQCSRALETLILRLLSKDPEGRPASASDVLTMLTSIEGHTDEPATDESPPGDNSPLDSLAGGVFVGRRTEMAELKSAVEDVLSGHGQVITIAGESGIGKSRITQEVATYARLRGAQVLWGRCYEEQGAPAYCPWRQAIQSYVQARDPDQLRSDMGPGIGDIAEIVSDIREKIPGVDTRPPVQTGQARFRLFESIAIFLQNASQRQPLMLVLDNLHWGDKPSLLLLEYLAPLLEGSRVLVVGTYRDTDVSRRHPLSQTVGELSKETQAKRILLRGFSSDDIKRFIEITAGFEPPESLVSALEAQTDGNPLFVTEVVKLLVQQGDLTTESAAERQTWEVQVPQGLKEVLGRRLDRLSAGCNEVLAMAAVVGREFGLDELERLAEGRSRGDLEDLMEEALAAHIVEEVSGRAGRFQFSHALFKQTLVEELSTTRLVRLHATIAEALEQLWEGDLETHAADLAYHYAEAASLTGTDKLVQHTLVAGERLLSTFAWEEAQSYFERALSAKEAQDSEDLESADLRFGLGRTQAALLQRSEAMTNLSNAFDYYERVGEISKLVDVAQFPVGPVRTGTPELVKRALALVPTDSHYSARLLSHHGFNLGQIDGDYEGAQESFNQALAIAEREGDITLKLWTLARAGHVGLSHGQPQECLLKDGQVIEMNQEVQDPYVEFFSRACVVGVLTCSGDWEGAQPHCEKMLQFAELTRDWQQMRIVLGWMTTLALLKGDWESARGALDRVMKLPGSAAPPGFIRPAMLEYQTGNADQGDRYADRLLEMTQSRGIFSILVVAVAAQTGRMTDRIDAIEEEGRRVLATSRIPHDLWLANTGLGLLAVSKGDAAAAETFYKALLPTRESFPLVEYIDVSIDRILGLLSKTMGQIGKAQTHFESGLAFCRQAGLRPEIGEICCDYGEMLLDQDSDGQQEKATALINEALEISRELGMPLLTERALRHRDILKA